MKKILFIMQSYPSRRSANVLCNQKILNEIDKDRFEIHILANRYFDEKCEEFINQVYVHRISRGIFWTVFTYAKQNQDKFVSRVILRIDRIFLRIRQILTILVYPSNEPILEHLFAKHAIKLHKIEHFDLVIAEHHGQECLYAGYKLKCYDSRISFLPILWDPIWGKKPAKYLPKKYTNIRLASRERKMLSKANLIIAMKSMKLFHERNIKEEGYYNRINYLDLPGIVKPKRENSNKSAYIIRDKINIVYSGVLSIPDRDPSLFIDSLNLTKYSKDITLCFFVTGNGIRTLKNKTEKFQGSIFINGYIPQEEIYDVYHQCDFLLNIGGPVPTMVPSKIFEYMSYGKPIISTYQIDNDSSKEYLEKYPLALLVDIRKEPEDNAAMIEKFIKETSGKKIEFDIIEKLFPHNTPKSYIDIIDELC